MTPNIPLSVDATLVCDNTVNWSNKDGLAYEISAFFKFYFGRQSAQIRCTHTYSVLATHGRFASDQRKQNIRKIHFTET